MSQNQSIQKICPFMSTADKPVACNSQCKLHREKPGFECLFQEISSISWNTKKAGSSPSGGGNFNNPPY